MPIASIDFGRSSSRRSLTSGGRDALVTFTEPRILILIPALLILLLFARRLAFPVSSRALFDSERRSFLRAFFRRLFWALPYTLMLIGLIFGIIAFAEPQQVAYVTVTREIETKTSVLIDDTSGSMSGKWLEILKAANRAFLEEYCRKDPSSTVETRVGLVTFDSTSSVRMFPTSDCAMVRRRIELLTADGGTAIDRGLWAGLALVLEFIDKGEILSPEEVRKIQVSLKERVPYVPASSASFCKKYPGLSMILYTDGDFPGWANTREQALAHTSLAKGTANDINPFHVIDIAHALCIRTYFYAVGMPPPAYVQAFTTPAGMGEVKDVSHLTKEEFFELYRKVAQKEKSRMIIEEQVRYNPLKNTFIGWALVFFMAGAILSQMRTLSRNHARPL